MAEKNPQILFDKFEIIECYKKDDFTGVYLARHIYLGKEIILKCLNTETVPDNSVVERFKREAKILAKLEHPNIIKVYDFGTYEKYFYISFEYFRGNSLRDTIKQNKTTDKQKKQITVQILEGLSEAHRSGIIHRDIKPENIFVDDQYKIKIGDFGLALSKTESFVTSKSSIVGTPCYMSPEQIAGDKVTTASDLFSLGVVLYELFMGSNPFLGEDINETINNVISKDYNKLFGGRESLPEEFKEFIKETVIRNASARISSCKEGLEIFGVEAPAEEEKNKEKKGFGIFLDKRLALAVVIPILVFVMVYFFPVNGNQAVEESPQENKVEPTQVDNTPLVDNTDENEADTKAIETDPEKVKVDKTPSENIIANVEPPKDQENTEQIPEEKIIQYGDLKVECIPWAKVYIDSIEYDTTPIEEPIRLVEGRHKILLVHPNFPRYESEIFVEPNNLSSIKVSMDTLYGWLDCKVFPWGELSVNNKRIGQTPLPNPLQLVPGKYNLQVSNPHFETYHDTVFVMRNDTLTVTFTFKK